MYVFIDIVYMFGGLCALWLTFIFPCIFNFFVFTGKFTLLLPVKLPVVLIPIGCSCVVVLIPIGVGYADYSM